MSQSQYFYGNDHWQYPQQDLASCLALNRFDFAVQANVVDQYAKLSICENLSQVTKIRSTHNNVDQ